MENDGHQDVYDCVQLLLNALALSKASGTETDATASANDYLHHHLQNYRGLLYARPLTACYEFMVPRLGSKNPLHWKAGWYWRHPKHTAANAMNWHGPFASRKAAVQARLATLKRSGAPATPLAVLERDIFP